jgi:hypothetical protein
VLVATDYFTKWTEVVALKNMTHREVTEFIAEHIIHRIGILQIFTKDQGTSFMSKEVREFAESYKIKLLNSYSYYAQANRQARSSNRRYLIILSIGIRSCLKFYGLIKYLNTVLLKFPRLSLFMDMKQFFLWR